MRANLLSGAGLGIAGVVLAVQLWADSPAAGVLAVLLGLLVGGGLVLATLRRGPHTPWTQARSLVGPDRAVVFWKPTCVYCIRLRRALRGDPQVVWVNVWADRAANAEVRRHNVGDELTPTALVGERVLRNPSADEVRSALGLAGSR